MKYLVIFLLSCFFLFGCTSGFQDFYKNSSPEKFNPTANVRIFDYGKCEIDKIYDLFYKDYLFLGEASFNGPYEESSNAKSFAMSIGADILITSAAYQGSRSGTMEISTPDQQTTYHSGTVTGSSGGYGNYSGTSTTYGTKTTQIPYTVHRYDQAGFFLKNVKNVKPIFEKTNVDFPKSGVSEYDGIWSLDDYIIKIYNSEEYIVGINQGVVTSENRNWKPNQLKLLISRNNHGIYLTGDHQPVPASYKINNFGYLEINTQCIGLPLLQLKKTE